MLDSSIDNHFISFIEYKEAGTTFNRIDSDISDVLKNKDESKLSDDDKNKLKELFKQVSEDKVNDYSVESLKNEDVPAIILISEHTRRMKEMQSRFAGMDLGMNFNEEKKLVINENNTMIQKLLSLRDSEDKKEKIDLICKQIIDLALLSNKELDPEELEGFIQRSNKLMSMIISL